MAASGDFEVSLLTRHPERWKTSLTIDRPAGLPPLVGPLATVSGNPADVVPGSDIVLLCLPGYAIRQTLLGIRGCLAGGTAVGSVVSNTGFFSQAMDVFSSDVPLFGLQRVPFIARTEVYGKGARLLGYKDSLAMAVEHTTEKETLRVLAEQMFGTPVRLLDNHYEASLSNSNPLLHPSRLYDLWHDWREGDTSPRVPFFYGEWTENASRLYIDMDAELQALLLHLPVRRGAIPSVLDYYQSTDAASLAAKLRSIEAFKGIPAPMKPVQSGFIPDWNSRYFTEDFPFGLAFIRKTADEHGLSTPTMDRIYNWWFRMTMPMTTTVGKNSSNKI
jgi:hypothetical protein